jgi:hypothetical protein
MIAVVSLTLISCGSEKTESDILRELSDRVEQESQINLNRLITAKQEETLNSFLLKDTAPKNMSNKLCSAINSGNDHSILFEQEAYKVFKETVLGKCKTSKEVTRTFPTMITSLTYSNGKEVSYLLKFNKAGIIINVSNFNSTGLKLKREEVLTRDNTALSVYSFFHTNKPSTTFYIRTASMQSKPSYYGELIKLVLSQKFNLVIEEVRGARNSEGTLRWLDKKSTKDAEDIIKWIKKDSLTDGKIIAFGEGHDALMALTAAVGKEKLQSIISCSAPIGMDKKYTYKMLEFIWESGSAQKILDFNNKVNFLRLQKVGISNIDKYLFGKEIKDYQEFVSSEKSYWAARNFEKKLRSIKYPVVHVAGLNGDPTSLGLFKKYRFLTSNNRHAFYLHKGGAGCGDIITSRNWSLYASGNARRPHVSRYFKKINKHKSLARITSSTKVKKVYFDFQKPALFNIFPELEMFFGAQNISALSLNNLRDNIEGAVEMTSKTYINGIVEYNVGIKTDVVKEEGKEVQLGLTLSDNKVVTGTDSLISNEITSINSFSPSVLVNIAKKSILKLKLIPKVPSDFSTPFSLSIGMKDDLNKVLVIPFTKAVQRPFVNITVEDL